MAVAAPGELCMLLHGAYARLGLSNDAARFLGDRIWPYRDDFRLVSLEPAITLLAKTMYLRPRKAMHWQSIYHDTHVGKVLMEIHSQRMGEMVNKRRATKKAAKKPKVELRSEPQAASVEAKLEQMREYIAQSSVPRAPTVDDVVAATGCSIDDVSEAWSSLKPYVTAGIDVEACRKHIRRHVMKNRTRIAWWFVDKCGGIEEAIEVLAHIKAMEQPNDLREKASV